MDNLILLILGLFISVLGITNIKGNISTIHSYNRRKVKEEDIIYTFSKLWKKQGEIRPASPLIYLRVYAAALSEAYSTRCFHCSINAVICAGGSALSKPRACVT